MHRSHPSSKMILQEEQSVDSQKCVLTHREAGLRAQHIDLAQLPV